MERYSKLIVKRTFQLKGNYWRVNKITSVSHPISSDFAYNSMYRLKPIAFVKIDLMRIWEPEAYHFSNNLYIILSLEFDFNNI